MSEYIVGAAASSSELTVGLVRDNAPAGAPASAGEPANMRPEALAETLARVAVELCGQQPEKPLVLGLGFPGIIRNGVVEDSPNLPQFKGAKLGELMASALASKGLAVQVRLFNDADAIAAGLAARRGLLDRLIRVWTLGTGIGFGRYPYTDGVQEGGHMVVTLDPRETFCGCGGRGHLEGVMGNRAMRLRFLDLEPEEVFAQARQGDERCVEFELLWHRALAAASATSIHLDGPGRFFIAGANARFVRTGLLSQYLGEMVTMSPLQGSVFEVVEASREVGIVGAAVNAARAISG